MLSRGLKFGIRPEKLDYCQTLTPFEKLVRSLKDQTIGSGSRIDFNFVKTKLKEIAHSYFHGYSMDGLPLTISRAELLALRNLSKNKNIVILRPDKGNDVVILNKMMRRLLLLLILFSIKQTHIGLMIVPLLRFRLRNSLN